MAKYAIKTLYFHETTSFHMQGKNFGARIDISTGAKVCYDDEAKEIHIYYNGKTSSLSSLSAKNWDYVATPAHVAEYFGAQLEAKTEEPVKRGRGRPPAHQPEPAIVHQPPSVPYPSFDPNDLEAAARHRELVRAASANSNKNHNSGPQNDYLIQEARNQAMGLKHPTTSRAQVQTAQQVGESATVVGKKKIVSHAELRTQVAAEAKE